MKKMIIQLQQKFEDLKKKLEKFDKMPITLTEYEIKLAFRCLFLIIEELECKIQELKRK